MDEYVKVPLHAAQTLMDIQEISKKGHSADVKYIERDDEYIVYDVDKTKRVRKAS